MIDHKTNLLEQLKKTISKERKIVREINSLLKDLEKVNPDEKEILFSHMNSLKNFLKKTNMNIPRILEKISLIKHLKQTKESEIYNPPKQIESVEQTDKKPTEQKSPKIPLQ